MQTPSGSSGCGGENHIHARDPYIQKRSDNAGNQVHTMEAKTLPPPHNHQKDEDLLEVEGRMGPAPVPAPASTSAAASQFRPPLPNTDPNMKKDNATGKRKRAAPKRFRPATPNLTAMHLPLPEAPPKPKNDVPDTQPVSVCESTPWPATGKM